MAGSDLCPAQKRTDAQNQLIQINGFYHVIVYTDTVTALLGGDIVFGGHEQDGDVFIECTDIRRKFKTVYPRHHDVRYDQIKHRIIHSIVCFLRIRAAGCLIAGMIQKSTNRAVEVFIIFHHKNFEHSASPVIVFAAIITQIYLSFVYSHRFLEQKRQGMDVRALFFSLIDICTVKSSRRRITSFRRKDASLYLPQIRPHG